MTPRSANKPYLEDFFLLKKLKEEDEKARKQIYLNQLKKFQENVDKAFAELLDATFKNQELGCFKIKLENAQAALSEFQSNSSSSSSSSLIYASLTPYDEIKEIPKTKSSAVDPIKIFTPNELEKIRLRYRELPQPLKDLMDAALGEDITLDLVTQPVFIKGDGHIYEAAVLNDFLKGREEAMCPHNQDLKYKRNDIIPCNSLIIAMQQLLEIIDKGDNVEAKSIENQFLITEQSKSSDGSSISKDIVTLMEAHYKKLPNKHKLLFDAICRDPYTHQIMLVAVILPDGRFYDLSTAKAALTGGGKSYCPLNNTIPFTEKDIVKAVTVNRVLEQFKTNIQMAMKQAQSINKENLTKDETRPSLSPR